MSVTLRPIPMKFITARIYYNIIITHTHIHLSNLPIVNTSYSNTLFSLFTFTFDTLQSLQTSLIYNQSRFIEVPLGPTTDPVSTAREKNPIYLNTHYSNVQHVSALNWKTSFSTRISLKSK